MNRTILQSMYTGSLVGSGALVFATFGYVIAYMQPDLEIGARVEVNPRLLSAIFGEDEEHVVKAIEHLCSPDPESRSKEEEGRRLVRLGQFDYRVVNGAHYTVICADEARREYYRLKKADERVRKRATVEPGRGKSGPLLPQATPGVREAHGEHVNFKPGNKIPLPELAASQVPPVATEPGSHNLPRRPPLPRLAVREA